MRLAWLIGLRFSLSSKGSRYLSFITLVSLLGLALGVMALVVVVSVMNGFDSQLRYRILGAVPHMVVSGVDPSYGQQHNSIVQSADFLQREGILVYRGRNRMVSIFGVDEKLEHKVSVLPQHMMEGSLQALAPGSHGVVLGAPLARQLGVWPGDSLTILIPQQSKNGNNIVPRLIKLTLAGTFEMQSEVDYGLVVMNVTDLQTGLGLAEPDTRLKLDDVFRSGEVRAKFATRYPGVKVSDWTKSWGDFFETVRLEKIMMFILLSLIVAIAAFNTVSSLSMMVKEKQAVIATLRTMGLSSYSVMGIFVVQGSLIGVAGTCLGLVLGLPLAFHVSEVVAVFEQLMGGRMLAGTYFDSVPTDVRLADIVLIVLVSSLISIGATLFPAYRAARINPAAVLKSE